jgi:hypothetical protein
MARLIELEGKPNEVTISSFVKKPVAAHNCNMIEEKENALAVSDAGIRVPVDRRGVMTVRFK